MSVINTFKSIFSNINGKIREIADNAAESSMLPSFLANLLGNIVFFCFGFVIYSLLTATTIFGFLFLKAAVFTVAKIGAWAALGLCVVGIWNFVKMLNNKRITVRNIQQ